MACSESLALCVRRIVARRRGITEKNEYDSRKPTPVVLAFHGGGANADNMVVFSGLNKKS